MDLIFFLVLFAALFSFSRLLTSTLTMLLVRVTRSHGLSIQLLSFLFLPGVIIHELAHWFVASILFVPTGEIEFLPQVHGDTVKLGSVQVAKTDPFRRFAIGVAPVVIGLLVILGIFWLLSPALSLRWETLVCIYVLFEIGNTMFSSSKDLEGIVGLFIFTGLIVSFLIFIKVPVLSFLLTIYQNNLFLNFLSQINKFLIMAVGIDVVVVFLLKILVRIRR